MSGGIRLIACAALLVASPASIAAAIGVADDFEDEIPGTFPGGWLDVGALNPDPPNPPLPSAIVVATTDALGNPTQALALVDAVAESQGIYRVVPQSVRYTSRADVRIDRYADAGQDATTVSDWAIEVGVNRRVGTTDLAFVPSVGVFASTLTEGWRLYVTTENVYVDLDLGVAATLGTWYTVEVDLDVVAATVRSLILETASGNVLADVTTLLSAFGPWDATVDGVFDVEGFFDGELTGSDAGNLVVIDNVDQSVVPVTEPASLALLALGLAGLGWVRRRRCSAAG
jgi:PEP-CTERM motif